MRSFTGIVIGLGLFAACTTTTNHAAVCGDGLVQAPEQCDDGNNVSGDGCSATCTREIVQQPVCGDGHVDSGEECDDANTTPGDGCSATCKVEHFINTTWALKDVAGTTRPCPTGYDTAAVIAQAIDASGNPVGSPMMDLFTCTDGHGKAGGFVAGKYRVYLQIENASGSMVYAATPSAQVDITTADAGFDAQILTDGGYFELAWDLVGEQSGNALTCTQAGADGVESAVTLSTGGNVTSDIFTCADHFGVTSGLAAGGYTVSVDALNTGNQSIGTAPALANKVIQAPNRITDLGTITIPITGM